MPPRPRRVSPPRLPGSSPLLAVLAVAAASFAVGFFQSSAEAGSSNGADVTVIELYLTDNYGAVGGIRAYALGTISCNVGNAPLWWCDSNEPYCNDEQHPVIAQNLYRLEDGRFDQLGMSWLKHGFFSTNTFDADCGSCQPPEHGGDQLGTGCTDAYSAFLNGSRPLGMRSEVNGATGAFPMPYDIVPSPQVIDQRLQVLESDINPSLHPAARFFVEGHYVAADDAAAGNGLNNASYREVTVNSGSFFLNLEGTTVREQAAIFAWQAVDPTVEIVAADVPSTPVERFHVARKVTSASASLWHYEYAIHNLNSHRSARSFAVDFPAATTFSNVEFRGPVHHSGEPYATTAWTITPDAGAGTVTWHTDTAAVDPDANALRFGTLFSFAFDADRPPAGATHTLGLFETGSPSELIVDFGIFADGFESGDLSAWSSVTP